MANRTQQVFEFLPLSIRIETAGGVAMPLVLRGTPLPATRSEQFSTAAAEQSAAEVSLYLGESPLTRNNIKIGSFHLRGIPPQPQGAPQILVEFAVDKHCTITAKAILKGSTVSAEQEFQAPVELSDETIAKLLAEAEASRASDETELLRIEATNNAKSLLAAAEKKLKGGPDSKLNEAVAALGLALASDDSDDIRTKSDALRRLLTQATGFSNFFTGSDIFADLFKESTPSVRKQSTAQAQVKASPLKQPSPAAQKLSSTGTPHQLGKVFGGGGTITLDPQLCFVLMPFATEYQELYEDHLRPVIQKAGLRCERADEIAGAGSITWDIWERVNRARFLIAELTNQNPNVFYELGLAHALGKDVVLITQDVKYVPFDLQGIRCLVYGTTPRGMEKFRAELQKTIETLIKSS